MVKAKALLDKLSRGSDVSMRDLEAALGKDGMAEYEGLWQHELDNRKIFETKPGEITRYEELIHAADFDENRANGIKQIGKRSKKDMQGRNSKKRLREQAETKYEKATEYLSEIIGADDNLRIWFDRDLDFDANTTTLGIDCVSVARTVTSRSKYKLSDGMAIKRSKADVKKEVLENAIGWMESDAALGKDGALGKVWALGKDGVLGVEEQIEYLKAKLAKLKKDGL